MENMKIYDAARVVPKEAKRNITGGRLKGMTDINPMWRIKALTEQFGPCGIGWKYEVTNKWLEPGADGEVAAFVDIELRYKWQGEWSDPIPGTGGSAFVAKEFKGLYTSDECFKMALTDAISVACKALGFGADVYWDADRSKYDRRGEAESKEAPVAKQEVSRNTEVKTAPPPVCTDCGAKIEEYNDPNGKPVTIGRHLGYTTKRFGRCLCVACGKRALAAEEAAEQTA